MDDMTMLKGKADASEKMDSESEVDSSGQR